MKQTYAYNVQSRKEKRDVVLLRLNCASTLFGLPTYYKALSPFSSPQCIGDTRLFESSPIILAPGARDFERTKTGTATGII